MAIGLIPDLLLVGRDAARLQAPSAAANGNQRWTDEPRRGTLAGPDRIFMDCASTGDRPARVRKAIRRGQTHSYREADGAHS